MSCESCKSDKIVSIDAKCSDMCCIQYLDEERNDYVPDNLGIGGGDYINLEICFTCGKVQGIKDVPDEDIRSIF